MTRADPPVLEFSATRTRGAFTLDAAFTAQHGITALFGPSGCGKSTILQLIAGTLRPDNGRIVCADRVLYDTKKRIDVPSHRRRVGLVFQDAQLFPHLTVRQNLAFARWFAPIGGSHLALEAIAEALAIDHVLSRRTPQLSGGERQRVALARAVLSGPQLLLLDEPLASLDDARRAEILPLIERLRDEFHIPMLYVTHARGEVERLAERVVTLAEGRVTGIVSRAEFQSASA